MSIQKTSKPDANVRPAAAEHLRIAVLNRVFSPTGGGAERYSIALVEQLAQHHEIHVFAQQIDHHWPGVTYHSISAPIKRPRWINQLWYATATWWQTRSGFDVVHSHENTWHGNVQTVHVLPLKHSLFQGRAGIRRVLRWCKVLTSPRLLVYLWLELMRFAYRPNRAVIVTSDTLMEIMKSAYPAGKKMLSVIVPGVTLPVKPRNALVARRILGLPVTAKLMAFVANDYRKKGLSAGLSALKILPSGYELAVVGNAQHVAEFRQEAQSLGLGQRVHFLGNLKDMSPLYEAVDCLIHPTTEDTFGMVVLEAMAHSLPVVVSDSRYCGIAGLLTHRINALVLSSPTNAMELAELVAEIFDKPDMRDFLALQSRKFASRYVWESVAKQQEMLYANIGCLRS